MEVIQMSHEAQRFSLKRKMLSHWADEGNIKGALCSFAEDILIRII